MWIDVGKENLEKRFSKYKKGQTELNSDLAYIFSFLLRLQNEIENLESMIDKLSKEK